MKFFLLILVFFTGFVAFGQAGSLDTTFNNEMYTNYGNGHGPYSSSISSIQTITEQPDGKVVLGGQFQTFNAIYSGPLVRLNQNGSFDTTFQFGYADSDITSTKVQNDGKILVGGFFNVYNNITQLKLVRLNADGSTDNSFNIGTGLNDGASFSWVNSIVLQPDGKILIGGKFNTFNGQSSSGIVRLNSDGSLDPNFSVGLGTFGGEVTCIDLLNDGSLLVGGSFSEFNGVTSNGLIKLDPNGSVDNTFTSGMSSQNHIKTIHSRFDGTIYIGGQFIDYGGIQRFNIALINADGSLNTTFNTDQLNCIVLDIQETLNGNIIVAGDFTLGTFNNVICLTNFGVLSSEIDFGTGTDELVNNILVQTDGAFFLGGNFWLSQNHLRPGVIRYQNTGIIDYNFLPIPSADEFIREILQLSNNKTIIIGTFSRYNGYSSRGVARLKEDGTIDSTFYQSVDSILNVNDIVALPNGKFIISAYSNNAINVYQLLNDGTIDASYSPQIETSEYSFQFALQPDGKLLVYGSFFHNGSPNIIQGIIRLDPNGQREPNFFIPINNLKEMIVENNGKIVVGGYFLEGQNLNHVRRYLPNGFQDPDFTVVYAQGSSIETVNKIIPLQNGNYLIAGGFSQINNHVTAGVAMIDQNGNDIPAFTAEGFECTTIALLPNGKILIAGGGNNPFITPFKRLNNDGTTDSSFVVTNAYCQGIISLVIQTDGKIIAAGNFTNGYEWRNANNIVRLNNDVLGMSPINLGVLSSSEVTCSSPASYSVFGYFGVAPYSYEWNTNPITIDSNISISSAGTYNCIVTDSDGYSKTTSFLIGGVAYPSDYDLNSNLSLSSFRPGFESLVWLNAFNDGCLPATGQLKLAYDPLLDFVSSNPAPTAQNGDTLIWDFTNITYDSAHITPQITFNTSVLAVIGDTIDFTTIITPIAGDADTTNNIKYYSSPVINGYDPNIKSVYPLGKCDVGYIEQDQLLTYTVQFQNTGNSEAINIAIIDSLSPNLDLNTVRVVGKSHEQWTEVLPGNVLKFHFDNINLPDSTSNEPASHGYVIFEVKPVSTWLNQNTKIANLADIYFDFNPAIRTNEVSNLIFQNGDLETYNCLGAGVNENLNNGLVVVYPNPTSGDVTIEFGIEVTNATIVFVDIQGKEVLRQSSVNGKQMVVELGQLTNGVYFLSFESENHSINEPTIKIIKTNH